MNEEISALIDDEVDMDEVARAMSMLQSNQKAAQSWGHYHLIGDVLREHAGVPGAQVQASSSAMLSAGFKHNLMSKLEQEPTVLAPNAGLAKASFTQQRKLPLAWSIAASCAAVMLVGWMALNQQAQQGLGVTNLAQASADEAGIPQEYLVAHQVAAPSSSSYYIQPASYAE